MIHELLPILKSPAGEFNHSRHPLCALPRADRYIWTSYVIAFIACGFLGVEMTSVTAFEARDLRSLRLPSQTIAYFVVFLYLLLAIGEYLNVSYNEVDLPKMYGSAPTNSTQAIIVIAAVEAGMKKFPSLLNGCMIFSALSASNTALYIASRTLYGMTRTINPWRWFSGLEALSSVWYRTGVPMWALFVSFLAFLWLPFLTLAKKFPTVVVS